MMRGKHVARALRRLLTYWLPVLCATAGQAEAREPFRSIPGVRELSDQMISRPLQIAAWREKGLDPVDASARVERARELMQRYDVKTYVPETDEYVFYLPTGRTADEVSAELMESGLFQYVQPDWLLFPAGCPDDPSLGDQWHHDQDFMQSCDAWDITTGSHTVVVGVVDTGIYVSHEDLLLNRHEGYNCIDHLWESEGGDISPLGVHGTLTTGSVAANGNNGVGVVGTGWNIGHRMLRPINEPGGAYGSDIRHGATVSIQAGDKVASCSWGGPDDPANQTTASYIKSIGGLLFWAAGNDSRNLTLNDRDADDLIVVGNSNESDERTFDSAYGIFVDVFAPGSNILTTGFPPDPFYMVTGGTSISCPIAAGVAALIWTLHPELTPDEVEALLKYGCEDIGALGVDDVFGYGRINTYRSLRYKPDVYVDFTYSGTETGTFWQPYNTMAEGIAYVPTGGVLAIKAGASAETPTISKAMTIVNWQQEVSVGN
jgi:subtilisin family serine protease